MYILTHSGIFVGVFDTLASAKSYLAFPAYAVIYFATDSGLCVYPGVEVVANCDDSENWREF